MDLKRDYDVWIPKGLWYAAGLSTQEKVLIAQISDLSTNEKGYCWAKNKDFAEFFGISPAGISKIITKLAKKGIIAITQGMRTIKIPGNSYKEPERRMTISAPYEYLINLTDLLNNPYTHLLNLAVRKKEFKEPKTENEENTKAFTMVLIPLNLWVDKELSIQEKTLLIAIKLLTHNTGYCYTGNKHFSEFFGLSERRISMIISSLKNKGILTIKYTRIGKIITEREIKINNPYNKWFTQKLNKISKVHALSTHAQNLSPKF